MENIQIEAHQVTLRPTEKFRKLKQFYLIIIIYFFSFLRQLYLRLFLKLKKKKPSVQHNHKIYKLNSK